MSDRSATERPKILIAIPCTDQVQAGFALDLAMLYGVMCAHGQYQCAIVQNRGTIIPQQRATLVEAATQYGASHILWLDSDMRFPKDTLLQLLAHDVPIVGANYPRRRPPILPTAEHRERGYLFTTEDAAGLAEVTQCGFGVMLTAMTVFHVIDEPWFHIGYTANDRQYVGEDFFFCHKARKAGFEILIDQDLSKDVKHIGAMEFTAEHTIITRDTALAQSSTVERQLELVKA